MAWLVDLPTQVRRILAQRSGGTGNDRGWADGTVLLCRVRQAEDIYVGQAVRMTVPRMIRLQDDADADDTFGIVAGIPRADGTAETRPGAGPATQNEYVLVMIAGVCPVLLDEDVETGEYAFPTDTDGAVRGETDPDTGAFGRFVGMGSAGGYASVKVGGGGGAAAPDFVTADAEFLFITPTNGLESPPLHVPGPGTITGWSLLGDAVGSAVVDVWKNTRSAYIAGTPPDVGDTITASAKPTMTSALGATSTSLTGWDTALATDDVLVANVDSVSGLGRLALVLHVERTLS